MGAELIKSDPADSLRELLTAVGVECEVLPGHDRVVVHFPNDQAETFVDRLATDIRRAYWPTAKVESPVYDWDPDDRF